MTFHAWRDLGPLYVFVECANFLCGKMIFGDRFPRSSQFFISRKEKKSFKTINNLYKKKKKKKSLTHSL